ncbi:hypothetical protein HMPREF1326_01213 [Akkermansia sp. KLE1605]|nr:hypothetical protein HMPREF1326_01213 [Akkermansia sp. KLE1605]
MKKEKKGPATTPVPAFPSRPFPGTFIFPISFLDKPYEIPQSAQ